MVPNALQNMFSKVKDLLYTFLFFTATEWCIEGKRFFSSPKPPDLSWGPSNLLLDEDRPSFPEIMRPGREVGHSPPSSTHVNKECSCTYAPHLLLLGIYKDNFNLWRIIISIIITVVLSFSHRNTRHDVLSAGSNQARKSFMYLKLTSSIFPR